MFTAFFPMTNKPKDKSDEMWVNPRSGFFRAGHQAWDRRSSDASNARYLELADIALKSPTVTVPTPVANSQDSAESSASPQIENPETNHE